MSSILNTKQLITSIKRRSFIPKDQRTFTDEDFLEMATEEINIGLMDQLIIARGDYLVYSIDVPIVAGTVKYAIPDRAHGNKLRDVFIVDDNETVVKELSQITLEDLYDEQNEYSTFQFNTFYVQNNYIVLNENNINSSNYLRMYFYMRPNKLVTIDRAGTALSVNTAVEVDTIDPLSAGITAIDLGTSTVVITSPNHGLTGNISVQITGTDSTPVIDGNFLVTIIDSNSFSIVPSAPVTIAGTTGSWAKLANTYIIGLDTVPKHFSTSIAYDVTGGTSPNKIKDYSTYPNSLNLTTKVISFRQDDITDMISVNDYITKAEESIVPNVPTEYHPIIAQRVAVACMEAMGDETNKQSAERKLAQMEKSVLRIVTNRVEGAPKKIRNRNGLLNQSRNLRRWG